MLTEKECKNALENLRVLERKDNLIKWNQVAPQINCDVFETLIKEHFELVKKYNRLYDECPHKCEILKQLQNEVDKYKHEYYSMCDLFENPQPYKFEDLKPKMWVWDNEDKKCKKIISILIIDVENTNKGTLVKKYFIRFGYRNIKFEENRFFPVTKAIQNEVKDDE